MRQSCIFCIYIAIILPLYAQSAASISGTVEWDKREINVKVSLNLKSTGINFPSGRIQAERILHSEYGHLMYSFLLSLSVDSAVTIGDLVAAGDFTSQQVERLVQSALSTGPVLSMDISSLQDIYTIDMKLISASLIRHSNAGSIPRIPTPLPSNPYTGIIVIANNPLPVHGRNTTALALPTFFPKIWDTNMNLIYERNTMDPILAQSKPHVTYIAPERIFYDSPSGMDEELLNIVGPNPLRIIARSLFGIRPTDLIIDREDALRIISSEENRKLLHEGTVVVVLDPSVLKVTLP